MNTSFSVTEVVTAVRCPRQLVLAREGHRVAPHGGDAIGQAAHTALTALAEAAARLTPADPLHQALASAGSGEEEVAAACYALAYRHVHQRAIELAPTVDGEVLSRLDALVRSLSRLLAGLLLRARRPEASPAQVVEAVLLGSDREVAIELDPYRVTGKLDLVCRDPDRGETWLWDLETYAGTEAARAEQVGLYTAAWPELAREPGRDAPPAAEGQGRPARPALLHVTGERVEIGRADGDQDSRLDRLRGRLQDMSAWLGGSRPPPAAANVDLCHVCPAQDACWSRWGRTLDESAGAEVPGPPPAPAAVAPPASSAREHLQPVSTPPPLPREAAEPPPPALARLFEALRPSAAAPPEITPPPIIRKDSAVIRSVTMSPPLDLPPMWLGTMERGKAPARLEPADLRTHVTVLGASGAGKTYFARTLVEEAVLAGVPALVFDVRGDLAQLAQTEPQLPAELADRRDHYAADVEVRLFTPGTDAGLRISLHTLHLPDATFGEDERAFCLATLADNLLATVDLPASWRKKGRGYLLQHLEAAAGEGPTVSLDRLVERLGDPDRIGAEPLLARKGQRESLIEQLRLLNTGADRLLFEGGRALDIGALTRPTAAGKTPLNIVWLNALGGRAARERFVTMALAELYTWAVRNPSATPQLLVCLDEVGPFVPREGEPTAKGVLRRLFRDGRKLGVCGVFCTRNVTGVDHKVLAQASTLAIGRVQAKQDKDRARKLLDPGNPDASGAVTRLAGAPSGRFLLRNPDRFPAPTWVQGRPLLTVDGPPWTEPDIRAHTPEPLRALFPPEGR